jgi:hypothetical protein
MSDAMFPIFKLHTSLLHELVVNVPLRGFNECYGFWERPWNSKIFLLLSLVQEEDRARPLTSGRAASIQKQQRFVVLLPIP